MKELLVLVAIIAGSIILILTFVSRDIALADACEAKGGVLVKGESRYTCIRAEVIK